MSWMACLARPIALKAVYLVLAWVLMISYQIFTQTALTTLTFFRRLYSSVSLIDKFKSRSNSLHLFIRLDVCLIIPNLNIHVWKRKKTYYSISSKFGTHPYRLSFVGLAAFSWTGLIESECSFTAVYSTV